ncbi:expressed unknown protein [Seminavis robusta]|uniref:SnoaL-like domain-containing protein n=1 Tax=Seminavis robusta TaxID=568900 RepID=A0A9N8H7Y8_9STRA|nr:expressed unknown protein [Seminavis robusta]|eukprot:Sro198_g084120.1 n/a (150) ;mRNA; f:59297-59746
MDREALLHHSKALCTAFANHDSMDQIVQCFSSTRANDIRCFEHGLQRLAPFLGRSFQGVDGLKEYFAIIADLLSYETMEFSDYIVDVEERVVSVRGKAKFTWKSTGNSWDEVFIYRLQLDEDGKVIVYEVWADSGAAYLASKGELAGDN